MLITKIVVAAIAIACTTVGASKLLASPAAPAQVSAPHPPAIDMGQLAQAFRR